MLVDFAAVTGRRGPWTNPLEWAGVFRGPDGPALHPESPRSEDGEMSKKSSQWEDTAFFIGTLLLTTGGGLMIQAGLDLPPLYAKLVWGGVCLVWGAVLIRIWIMREGQR